MMTDSFLELDIRPLIKQGREPISAILNAADTLVDGQVLKLIAPFDPIPLYLLMSERGFQHKTIAHPYSTWEIHFWPMNPDRGEDPFSLDLRKLDKPEIRTKLEASLPHLGRKDTLVVQSSYPLDDDFITERSFSAESEEVAPGQWETRIWRSL